MIKASAALALVALAGAAPPPAPAARIARIEARLFYTDSGKLSANLLDAKGHFAGWNTIIGEGPSGGAAEDVVIVVSIAQAKAKASDELTLPTPLEIKVVAKGKTIAMRRFTNLIIPYNGPAYAPLWLANVGCAQKVVITARLGGASRSAVLDMDCGE